MNILNFCTDTWDLWYMVGKLVRIFRIVMPIILIVFASIDLGKVVVSSDEKVIKKSTKQIAVRFIFAMLIFFVPVIISAVFSLVENFHKEVDPEGYNVCYKCVTNSKECEELFIK